jgi:hypothetical protein
LSAPPKPYFPVQTVEADSDGPNRLVPVIDETGVPVWQPGDGTPTYWEIISVGWSHGAASNRRDNTDIKGRVYLTDARVVVVSDHFAHGSRYRAYGLGSQVVLSQVATRVSKARAQRASAGTFLTGLMRLPWIMNVVFATSDERKALRGEIRLVSQHLTVFGDPESVMLIFKLRNSADTLAFVEALIERVKGDRLGWKGTTEDERKALGAVPSPGSVRAPEGSLPSVRLPGSCRANFTTSAHGSKSSRSFSSAVAPDSSHPDELMA